MNLKEAAQQALDAQYACNLSGLAKTLGEISTHVLWPEANRLHKGTDFVNEHPIVHLFLSKMASLNRKQCLCQIQMDAFNEAFQAVCALAHAPELAELYEGNT